MAAIGFVTVALVGVAAFIACMGRLANGGWVV
jgi:hypothetical protein